MKRRPLKTRPVEIAECGCRNADCPTHMSAPCWVRDAPYAAYDDNGPYMLCETCFFTGVKRASEERASKNVHDEAPGVH